MDKELKDLLLNIQSEVRQIDNRLNKIERTTDAPNYTYTDVDINSKHKS